jgi:hypothetical protein
MLIIVVALHRGVVRLQYGIVKLKALRFNASRKRNRGKQFY